MEQQELITALQTANIDISCGCFVDSDLIMFNALGIVWKLFPELEDKRDHDGLLYLKDLAVDFDLNTPLLMPLFSKAGYFSSLHSPFAIMVHPYLRRNMSRCNSYIPGLLQTLLSARIDWADCTIRLRIDEDCIMLSKHVMPPLERERWFGKKFTNDIENIPIGVARYAHQFCGYTDITEYNWENKKRGVVQLEIEEVHEGERYAIENGSFGCKYLHSTYDKVARRFDHFDGAIRTYSKSQLTERRGVTLDKSSFNLPYTKLFRIDGNIPIERWKQLIGFYLSHNTTVEEYFGTERNEK